MEFLVLRDLKIYKLGCWISEFAELLFGRKWRGRFEITKLCVLVDWPASHAARLNCSFLVVWKAFGVGKSKVLSCAAFSGTRSPSLACHVNLLHTLNTFIFRIFYNISF